MFISASNTHQNTKALCKLQMAKQVVFGNTTACAALTMPWVFVNYKQFTKDSICLWLFRLIGTQKANLHTIHTPLHLQMWRQLLEGGGGGGIYTTHEVTKYNSTSSDEAQSCSMQTEKVPKHTEQLAKAHLRAKRLAVSSYFVFLWLDKGVVKSIAQWRGSRLSHRDGSRSGGRKRRRWWRLRERGGTVNWRWGWSRNRNRGV